MNTAAVFCRKPLSIHYGNPMRYSLAVLVLAILPLTLAQTTQPGATQPMSKPATHVLSINGTRFLLDKQPFPYQGVSFFNALYNESFNKDHKSRADWLAKFKHTGINVFR